ncbi:DUF4352 domain-containing protein [Streptomyces luteolus]|uniref:DUF4352 domain-containing protein n=1 Tax=Streptomyces luteolus TaxID=3043615 RepID=A0ABT6T492_9ACTN|nr:hypothetical protein [Streptomyces sp. B-S-A12]MDI3422681.1 hypothetical protein [Streptomyces sp. B-S-A12]
MNSHRKVIAAAVAVVLGLLTTGLDDSDDAPKTAESAVVQPSSKAPSELLTEADVEQILGGLPVKPTTFSDPGTAEVPGCEALADFGTRAAKKIGFETSAEDKGVAELVVPDGKDTRVIEDIEECSTATIEGTAFDVRFTSAAGGDGNSNGVLKGAGVTFEVRTRVVDGDNVEVLVFGATAEQADLAIDTAVARYAGTELPEPIASIPPGQSRNQAAVGRPLQVTITDDENQVIRLKITINSVRYYARLTVTDEEKQYTDKADWYRYPDNGQWAVLDASYENVGGAPYQISLSTLTHTADDGTKTNVPYITYNPSKEAPRADVLDSTTLQPGEKVTGQIILDIPSKGGQARWYASGDETQDPGWALDLPRS